MNDTYLIAALITLAFATSLIVVGVGVVFILIPILFSMGVPLLTTVLTALLLTAVSMIFASISYGGAKPILFRSTAPTLAAATLLSPLGAVTATRLPEHLLKRVFAGFLNHMSTGNIDINPLSLCVISSIDGALLGAYLMRKKLSSNQIKMAVWIVLYLIAIKMFWDLLK